MHLQGWIVHEAAWLSIPGYVVLFLFFELAWGTAARIFFDAVSGNDTYDRKWAWPWPPKTAFQRHAIVLLLAAAEEALFRLLPIVLAKKFFSGYLFPAVILATLLFGLSHAIHGFYVRRITVHGFGGILSATLFLKCGGLHAHYAKAFLAALSVHYLFNIVSHLWHDWGQRQ